jgi:hypothetical protein
MAYGRKWFSEMSGRILVTLLSHVTWGGGCLLVEENQGVKKRLRVVNVKSYEHYYERSVSRSVRNRYCRMCHLLCSKSQLNVSIKVPPLHIHHAMNTYMGSKGKAPCILNLGTIC